MEFLIEIDKKIYEISELVKSVSYTDKLNDGCSKLEFSYIDDDLKLRNGATVRFVNDDIKFRGYVFKHGRNKKKEITVTAYDQLRYAKAKDVIVIKNDTVTTLTSRMCNYLRLKKGTLTDTNYALPTSVQDDKTWLDIIYSAIGETLTNKGKWYCLRDEYGSVAIRDLEDLKLNLVLGDGSLCYDFDYEKSIDDNFYNMIKIYVKGKDDATVGSFTTAHDTKSVEKFGLLQYFETMENKNSSQAKSKAEMLLKLYNREVETLSLNCLGDTRVRAGSSIYITIGDIGLTEKNLKRLIVRSVTHEFLPVHTMQIEVAI